ncbi:penicillin-binding transpeptidase domain-containing protein [Hansschlegelia quercus]|nr:penicillin-binding transpeptidase domain-containing protein [Hansschlegelia quercus]
MALSFAAAPAGAQGPADLPTAFAAAFAGVEACAALRDVAPGAETATSDRMDCARRLPPCATLDIATNVVALDRGVAPDTNAPVRRQPPVAGDPPEGVTLKDAFRRPVPWVYEEIARRVGPDNFVKALGAMRYGDAEQIANRPHPTGLQPQPQLTLSPVEQVEFLARLKRGELPTTAESQARTAELLAAERIGDANFVVKTGACPDVAWAVGWVDRGPRSMIFAIIETGGQGASAEDTVARAKRLMANLGLMPPLEPR